MPRLDLHSYIGIMRRMLVGSDGQEAAFVKVVDSINKQDYVRDNGYLESYSSKRISRILAYTSPVPEGTLQASSNPEVIAGVYKYFSEEIEPRINPHTSHDEIAGLLKVIEGDDSISDEKRDELIQTHSKKGVTAFLADTFLYALNRTRMKPDEAVREDDIALLAEANYRCPLCQNHLVETVKGKPMMRYEIVKILPDGLSRDELRLFAERRTPAAKLDSSENLIALDCGCAQQYMLDPTPDEYERLMTIKDALVRNYKATSEIGTLALEDEIRAVVSALSEVTNEDSLTKLNYEAVRIEKKMAASSYITKTKVQLQVVLYYKYIQELFSTSGVDFELVCSEVKTASKKLVNSGLSQEEIIGHLSQWFLDHSHLDDKNRYACEVVVSFFIQNCEVFSA